MKRILSLSISLLLVTKVLGQGITNNGASITLTPDAGIYIKSADTALYNKPGATLFLKGNVVLEGHMYNEGSMDLGSADISVRGKWRNSHTQTPGTSTVRFLGTGKQLLISNSGGFYNVVINKSDTLLFQTTASVSNSLQLVSGMIKTGNTQVVDLGSTGQISGETSGRYVIGNLQSNVTNLSGANNSNFGNIGVYIAANSNNLGAVTVKRTAGLKTEGLSYAVNPQNNNYKSIDRIWDISAPGATISPQSPVTLRFDWLSDNNNDFADFTQAQVWRSKDQGASWEAIGASKDASAYSIETQTTGFSIWTVSTGVNNPMPVTLLDFTAKARNGSSVLLQWQTATEVNNSHFELEQSADGLNFNRIASVSGAGNSNSVKKYAYVDYSPLDGRNYYRLKQIDFDGQFSYSMVRSVILGKEIDTQMVVYPNPFNDKLTFEFMSSASTHAKLDLYDSRGVLVLSNAYHNLAAGNNRIELQQLDILTAGMYYYKLTGSGLNETGKIVKF